MARARQRRKSPISIDRGMGLLEVIVPQGGHDGSISTLPPGRRDTGGFWFPEGYTQPGDIFTPAQRKLQAKQRQVQRHRLNGEPLPPPVVSGSGVTVGADATPSRPNASPDSFTGGLSDRSLPLPAPSLEAPASRRHVLVVPADRRTPSAGAEVHPPLAGPSPARAFATAAVVDSREGSD